MAKKNIRKIPGPIRRLSDENASNSLQNTTQKTKDLERTTPSKKWGQSYIVGAAERLADPASLFTSVVLLMPTQYSVHEESHSVISHTYFRF